MGGCCERKEAVDFDDEEYGGWSDDGEVVTQYFVISQCLFLCIFMAKR